MSGDTLQPNTEIVTVGSPTDPNEPAAPMSVPTPESENGGSQPAALLQKRRRNRLLLIAAVLLLLALVWQSIINKNGVEGTLIRTLQAHGYTVVADDLYPAAAYSDTSIRALLPDTALEEAVAASKAAGFPSDVDRTGQVVLYMTALSNADVITVFVIDRNVELAFVQTPNTDSVYPLWEE